jgi:hemolysin activation/secretion protein
MLDKQKLDKGVEKDQKNRRARFFLKIILYPAFYCLFFLGILSDLPGLRSQTIGPVRPPEPEPTQPKPLPPTQPPLESPNPSAPPTPEESLDVPGNITVKRFEFVGNTAFSVEELNAEVAEFLGKPVSFSQLLQAAERISDLYVREGYITSGAYIPSQEIKAGTVRIQVVEGSLEAIEVNASEGRLDPDYVRSRLAIATGKPLNVNRLQEALQLLQLDPLIENLKADLSAGTKPGTNLLSVSVVGADTFNVRLNLNNNRNPSVGSFERSVEISEANLFGIGDGISLTYGNTDGSDRIETSYSLPVNANNGTLSFRFQYTGNEIIEPPFDDLDIEVDTRDFELSFRQPVFREATPEVTREFALSLTAARRESDSSVRGVDFPVFVGANEEGETRISSISFGQEWLQRSRIDVLAARSQFNLGIGAFDATVNEDEPDSQFSLWRGQLSYLRRLDRVTNDPQLSPTLLLRSELQLTGNSLLSREQYSLGGQATVRGYRQDAALGDSGLFAGAEVRLPILSVPEVDGILQITPFIDFGTVWNVEGDNPDPQTLLGTGIGLLWQMGDNFNARLNWGIPLIDSNSRKRTWQENGVYFELEYNPF